MIIERHRLNRDEDSEFNFALTKFYKFDQKIRLNLRENKPVNLWAFKDLGLRFSTYSLVINDIDHAYKGIKSFLESGIRHLQLVYNKERSLKIRLGEDEFVVEKSQKKTTVSLFDWWKLFNMALILRNDGFKEELYSLLNNIVEDSIDPFWHRSMDLMLMCVGKKEFESSIFSDIKSIVSDGVVEYHGFEGKGLIESSEGKKILEKFWFPIMELYYNAYQGEQAAFNNLLEQYLKYKKAWIIENKENDNSSYWVDFPLLACCSYAHDKNISITVESDYIPSLYI